MNSITTKEDKYGWYYTFRTRNDGTIIIQQKNKKTKVHNEIHIYGKNNIKDFMTVIFTL